MSHRVALVVPGRFHSFDLGRALLARGHDVRLLTNYPGSIVERFGFPAARTHSFTFHGLVTRAWARFPLAKRLVEPAAHRAFGAWAARTLVRDEPFDIIHCWSGVSEELLRATAIGGLKVLTRGSAHIAAQRSLLEMEERRAGVPIDKPSEWMVMREQREYALAPRIRVLSGFAHRTFVEHGCSSDKLFLCPLGTPVEQFRLPTEAMQERLRRIRAGERLRILYVGALSCRKGALDIANSASRVIAFAHLRLVGSLMAEAQSILRGLPKSVESLGQRPQAELADHYSWADVFLFPTVEDGFAIVLAQAAAAGLPLLTTPNCGGPELFRQGAVGWEVPIRSPDSIVERLCWADTHREELAGMIERAWHSYQPRTWNDTAAELETLCTDAMDRSEA